MLQNLIKVKIYILFLSTSFFFSSLVYSNDLSYQFRFKILYTSGSYHSIRLVGFQADDRSEVVYLNDPQPWIYPQHMHETPVITAVIPTNADNNNTQPNLLQTRLIFEIRDGPDDTRRQTIRWRVPQTIQLLQNGEILDVVFHRTETEIRHEFDNARQDTLPHLAFINRNVSQRQLITRVNEHGRRTLVGDPLEILLQFEIERPSGSSSNVASTSTGGNNASTSTGGNDQVCTRQSQICSGSIPTQRINGVLKTGKPSISNPTDFLISVNKLCLIHTPLLSLSVP